MVSSYRIFTNKKEKKEKKKTKKKGQEKKNKQKERKNPSARCKWMLIVTFPERQKVKVPPKVVWI